MRDPIRPFAVASVLALATAALSAQEAPERAGNYASIGLGYGTAGYNNPGSGSSSDWGESYTGSLGFFAGLHWRLGVDASYYVNQGLGTFSSCCDTHSLAISGSAAFYPSVSKNLWLKADLGYGRMSGTIYLGNPGGGTGPVPYDQQGVAAGLGIGYDIRFGSGPMIAAPFLSYQSFWEGTARYPFRAVDGQGTFFALGVALGYSR